MNVKFFLTRSGSEGDALPTPDFRSDINALRALAVLLVVLFHFKLLGMHGGFVGVDVFFVISGFLMTKIVLTALEAGRFSLGAFYFSRARRIIPALACLSLVLMVLGAATLLPREYDTLSKHVQASLLFYSNHVYAGESAYFDAGVARKWLLHTWSLSVEFQFYVLFPPAVLLVYKLGLRRRGIAALLAVALGLILINSGRCSAESPTAYFYLLKSRAWELLAGGLVFVAAERFSLVVRVRGVLEWGGVALVLFAAWAFNGSMVWPGWAALLPVAGCALVLFAGNVSSPVARNGGVRWLGLRSYSIYLWHWPVAVFLHRAHQFDHPAACLAGVAFTLVAAEASYRLIEQPGRHCLQTARPWPLVAGLAGFVVLVAGAFAMQQDSGGFWRFGADAPRMQALEAARSDWGFRGDTSQKPYTAIFGTDGVKDPDVVILGDSHAGHLFPRIEAQTERPLSVAFLNRDGCLPIRGYDRADDPGMRCGAFTSAAWAHLLAHPPKRLVIASIWLTYFYPQEPGGNAPPWVCRRSATSCVPVLSDAQLDEAFKVLEADVHALVMHGSKVMILGPMPFIKRAYTDDELALLASKHIFNLDFIGQAQALPRPQIPVAEVEANALRVVQRLERVAKRSPAGAQLIQPERMLCHEGMCALASEQGTPYYLDASHMRPFYVRSAVFAWLDQIIYGQSVKVFAAPEADLD